jgi:type II secretory pathway pseudopilin PulG
MKKSTNFDRRSAPAFTLAEAMISMAVVAVLVTAAMNAAGAVGMQRKKTTDRVTAAALAEGLMTNVLGLAYKEPVATPLFGRETGELATDKSTYDDVDDFSGWTESPPRNADNTPMTDMTGWTRSVEVVWVQAATPKTVNATETGLKRVTVTVKRGNLAVAKRVGFRTSAP